MGREIRRVWVARARLRNQVKCPTAGVLVICTSVNNRRRTSTGTHVPRGKGNEWQKAKQPHLRNALSSGLSLRHRAHVCVYVANAPRQAELTVTNGCERKRPVPVANDISTEHCTARAVRAVR